MKRGYDKHKKLGKKLDSLEKLDQKSRDHLVKGIMDLLKIHNPSLLSCDNLFEFPLTFNRRRWYDNDPYLWFMFNTLKLADHKLLLVIENYLDKELNQSQ